MQNVFFGTFVALAVDSEAYAHVADAGVAQKVAVTAARENG